MLFRISTATSGGLTVLRTAMSDIQDRIAAARREAEGLKARIKVKKEELADGDCEQTT